MNMEGLFCFDDEYNKVSLQLMAVICLPTHSLTASLLKHVDYHYKKRMKYYCFTKVNDKLYFIPKCLLEQAMKNCCNLFSESSGLIVRFEELSEEIKVIV